MPLGDGTYKYFFNTKAFDESNHEIMDVLKFIETGDMGDEPTPLAKKMNKEYELIKANTEWEVTHMTLYEREQERIEWAKHEAEIEAKLKARAELIEIAGKMLNNGVGIDVMKETMNLSADEVEMVLKKSSSRS